MKQALGKLRIRVKGAEGLRMSGEGEQDKRVIRNVGGSLRALEHWGVSEAGKSWSSMGKQARGALPLSASVPQEV